MTNWFCSGDPGLVYPVFVVIGIFFCFTLVAIIDCIWGED